MKRILLLAWAGLVCGWLAVVPKIWHGQTGQAYYIAGIAAFAVAIAISAKVLGKKPADFGFKAPTRADFGSAAAAFGLLFVPAIALRLLLPTFDSWYARLYGLDTASGTIALALYALPLALVFEELGVRGLLHSSLLNGFGRSGAVLAAVAIFFTLMHSPLVGYSPSLAFSAGAMATILAYSVVISLLYQRTRSLFATTALHCLVNYFSAAQTYLHAAGLLTEEVAVWAIWGAVFLLCRGSYAGMLASFRMEFAARARIGPAGYGVLAAVAAAPLVLAAI
ncbi:MAG: CPBP family intramembrane glutamic endopeptidase [Candidatus Micrarchaeota archaeon]